MVSKINAVFRQIIGSEIHQANSGSRKRSSESLDDVSQDVLETPQPKRARTKQQSDDLPHSHSSTPFLKVASWIRKKASSFGENYFFRPVGNLMEMSYPVQFEEDPQPAVGNNHSQTNATSHAPSQQTSHQLTGRLPKKPSGGVSFKEPGEPPHRKQLSTNAIPLQTKPSHILHNGHHDESDGGDRVRRGVSGAEPKGQPANTSRSHVHANNSYVTASSRSKQEGYIPVRDKLFPDPRRRVVSQTHRARPQNPHTNLTATECVRLKEKQEYQQLIQQYTIRYAPGQGSVLAASETDLRPKESSKLHQPGARPKTTETSSKTTTSQRETFRPSLHSQRVDASRPGLQGQLGTRILPHQFSTQQEIREAVRQRIHAPASQLSPGSPSGDRPPPATPAQPDFNESASPVIMSFKPAPPMATPTMSAFQKSVCATPYLDADWVKDLKSRFESSIRIQSRNIEEQKTKLQLYEERRAKGQTAAQEHIKARISKAEREAGIVEDVIYTPEEEEEEEDDIEVIDINEEEEEEDDEEEEGDLPELTLEMDLEIDRALNPNPSNQGLVSGFRLNVSRRDMQTLAGLNWLNDEIMNFYFELLMERSNRKDYPSLHYFNTFFYPKLVNSGYASIRRWTKKTDIFTKDVVLVPVHLGMHWCLAVIDFRHTSIIFYDSMGSHNQLCLNALRDYVVSEYADKKKQTYSMAGWTYRSERRIPQQMNGSDCGMFACKYAEYISRDAPITFTQHDMPYFRRRMVWEILHKTLL